VGNIPVPVPPTSLADEKPNTINTWNNEIDG